jgi:hypothetical protein
MAHQQVPTRPAPAWRRAGVAAAAILVAGEGVPEAERGGPPRADPANTTIGMYAVAWLKQFVDDHTHYEQFLWPPPGGDLAIEECRDACPRGRPGPALPFATGASSSRAASIQDPRVLAGGGRGLGAACPGMPGDVRRAFPMSVASLTTPDLGIR